ncbi:uncharacterized protein LOC110981714 [Acanthaster planci]|uniref:Uncharacterized protein LOC110981714 n=1 Tax=Acanthaster planci TaxID=133434 RepID=A0A8B7YRA2_ACAPL|nr:uncharacterized protein LOC110981714 [Acanthaster planci]
MPDTCSAVGCKNRRWTDKKKKSTNRRELHFYRIPWGNSPQKLEKRRLWLQALCRKKLPECARICSAHFISGAASDDPNDPDYVPSVFSYNGNVQHLPIAPMDKCCIPNCRNDFRYNQTTSLSFHPFPKAADGRNQWIQEIGAKFGQDLQVTKDTRICSRHFRKSDFVITETGMKKIKPRVLPSKFQPSSIFETQQDEPDPSMSKHEEADEYDSEDKLTQNSRCDSPASSTQDDPQDAVTKLRIAKEKITTLEAQCKMLSSTLFLLERFSNDSQCIEYYTGFADYATLKAMYTALEPKGRSNALRWMDVQKYCRLIMGLEEKVESTTLPLIDEFFLFMCYVKQGFCEQDLAIRFNMPVKSVTQILLTWINYLFVSLRKFQIWPSQNSVDKTMPLCFKNTFPNTRVILSCTEITVQMPIAEIYGHENTDVSITYKGLLGISPFGAVTFVSDLYDGCVSDIKIAKFSRIFNLIAGPSTIMAPASFQSQDASCANKSAIVVPPFWSSSAKGLQTLHMMELQRHIEQSFAYVKDYRVFQSVIPKNLAVSANQLWMVCALLANFKKCPYLLTSAQ